MSLLRSYRNSDSGAVAIEAVFALPFLILIGFGAVDGSLLMMQNHKAETGLISAGGYLARSTSPKNLEGNAKRLATTGQVRNGGTRQISNWSESDIVISYKAFANADGGSGHAYRGNDSIQVVQLSTNIPFSGIGFLKSISGGAVTIEARYEERLIADQS